MNEKLTLEDKSKSILEEGSISLIIFKNTS